MLIRYYGSCGHTSGYAHAANEMCLALLSAGAQLEIRVLGPEGERFEGDTLPLAACVRKDADLAPNPDIAIFHTQCHDAYLQLSHFESGTPQFAGGPVNSQGRIAKKRVVYTTWDSVSSIPAEVYSWLADFDQVWVPSRQNARCFQGRFADDRVVVVPHSFREDRWKGDTLVGRDARLERFRFGYLGAWNGRKNPAGILRAWARAFSPEDPVELHLHCTQTPMVNFIAAAHATGLTQGEMAPVKFTNHELTENEVRDFYKSIDCFVTATRAESWNLPAFDAMLAGCYVISPSGLGSENFLRDATATLYGGYPQPCDNDVELLPEIGAPAGTAKLIVRGPQGVTARCDWKEPDLNQLADSMRWAANRKMGHIRLDYDPRARFGRQTVGNLAMRTLLDLLNC